MSDELEELYQDILLDHSRNPRNFGALENPQATAKGKNPYCGDKVKIDILLDGEVIVDLRFEGEGCAISLASASVMTELVKGKTKARVREMIESFRDIVSGEDPKDNSLNNEQEASAFYGVSKFPVRVKCATLPWHTLGKALDS